MDQDTTNMFRSMTALIVEDDATSMVILRSILLGLNLGKVEEASSGDQAIEAIRAQHFDLVLCDYNLGPGKNGRQILEEARVEGLIDVSTVFFLITGENNRTMVMGAVEHQPDDYLTKPFTPKDLLNRLMATMRMRQEFADIDDAIRQKQHERAITLCDQKIRESPHHQIHTLRLKAETMMDLKQYEKATSVYREVLRIKEVPWAMLGIARASVLMDQPAETARLLSDVIRCYPEEVEAYDRLAKLQESKGDSELAQDTIEKAVSISPNAVPRQLELGRLAIENKCWRKAEEAYRASISLAYDSCYKTPDNYLALARVLQTRLEDTDSTENLDTLTDIINILDQVRTEFAGDAVVDFMASVLEAESQALSGKVAIAYRSVSKARRLYQQFSSDEKVVHCTDLVSALSVTGNYELALKTIEDLDDDRIDCRSLADELRRKISHIKVRNRHEELNQKGIALYESGKIADAYQVFQRAANVTDANYSVILNAIQACLELVEQKRTPSEHWSTECEDYFERIAGIDCEDHRFERFTALRQNFTELTQY
jgi:DNA-binding response OmpR family regulator|tara:strand:+ start:786 stop:2417 length:1632 start_codon:yes stop_codon:yes gene_type:complete